MDIKNITSMIRLGDKFLATIDVDVLDGHSSNGVYGTIYTYEKRVEIRRQKHCVAMFVFAYEDNKILPEWWQDSELLWTNCESVEAESE